MGNTNGYFSKSIRSTDMMFTWSKAFISVYGLLDQQWPWPHFQSHTGHYWNLKINLHLWYKMTPMNLEASNLACKHLWAICPWCHKIRSLWPLTSDLLHEVKCSYIMMHQGCSLGIRVVTLWYNIFHCSPTDGSTLHYVSGMILWLTALHHGLDPKGQQSVQAHGPMFLHFLCI